MTEKIPLEATEKKNGLWMIGVMAVLAVIIIAGGVVYSWQKAKETEEEIQKQLTDLQTEVEKLQPTITPLPTPTPIVQLTPTTIPDEYEGWQTYTNETFGYTVKHPSDTLVRGQDLDKLVEFEGPFDNNEYWPRLTISHHDSDFYHPPAGTDVITWVTDQSSYDAIGEEFKVAGLPTIHLVSNRSPQSYASDNYYFIKGTQLYEIDLLHAADKQDWVLYNKFLKSFEFLE